MNFYRRTFIELSQRPAAITNDHLIVIKEFLMGSYGEDFETIEEMRLDYLNHKLEYNLRMWPPSSGALLEQAKRASYVAGHLWGSAHISRPELPQLTDWGFKFTANNMCIPA